MNETCRKCNGRLTEKREQDFGNKIVMFAVCNACGQEYFYDTDAGLVEEEALRRINSLFK